MAEFDGNLETVSSGGAEQVSEQAMEKVREEEKNRAQAAQDLKKQSWANLVTAQYLIILLKCVPGDTILGDISNLIKIDFPASALMGIIYPFVHQDIDDPTIKKEFTFEYDIQSLVGFCKSAKHFLDNIPTEIKSKPTFHQGVVKYIFDIASYYNLENIGDYQAGMQKTIGTPKYDEYKLSLQNAIDTISSNI